MRFFALFIFCLAVYSDSYAADDDKIKVYRTLSKPLDERALTSRQLKMTRFIEEGGLALSVALPLVQAKRSYSADPNGCITMFIASINSDEIESKIISLFPIWLYVRTGFADTSHLDLETVGTFSGGNFERILPLLRGAEWKFAGSFEELLAQVKQGELDAATFGEAGVRDLLAGDTSVRPLSEEPFGYIPSRIRCKNTPKARAFIDDLNARTDASKATTSAYNR